MVTAFTFQSRPCTLLLNKLDLCLLHQNWIAFSNRSNNIGCHRITSLFQSTQLVPRTSYPQILNNLVHNNLLSSLAYPILSLFLHNFLSVNNSRVSKGQACQTKSQSTSSLWPAWWNGFPAQEHPLTSTVPFLPHWPSQDWWYILTHSLNLWWLSSLIMSGYQVNIHLRHTH